MLENKFYSAFPAAEQSSFLLQSYRQLLMENLLKCVGSIQKSLKLDISFLLVKYQGIDVNKKFSPAIFNLFSRLTHACYLGSVPMIIDILHQLSILDDVEIYDSNFQFSTILTERWEIDFISKLRSENFPNKSNENTLILPIITRDLSVQKTIFDNLSQQIKRIDFNFFQEIETYVTRVKLFNGKALKAATSASVFGAIYLKLPPKEENARAYFADHIIHETSHLQLDILLAFDRIVLNEDSERFKAPIRIDPRPMFGIFHATFVLCRMVRLFQRIIQDTPHPAFTERLDTFRRQFDEGLETIEKYAVLTEKGQLINESFVKVAEI